VGERFCEPNKIKGHLISAARGDARPTDGFNQNAITCSTAIQPVDWFEFNDDIKI
jgi:hypothetical protein